MDMGKYNDVDDNLEHLYDLKVRDDGTLAQVLRFWTLSIILFLSKNIALFIFQNTSWRLDSVSVFR
jgi:hypothetical protein